MPYSAKAVANEFIRLAKQDHKQLTPMQVQKLVYFAYGWYLAITGERLIDERVEAWRWGPVIPSLYTEFRKYGSDPITEEAADYFLRDGKFAFRYFELKSDSPEKDELARNVIARVWQVYGHFTAVQLSNMTHEPNSPWTLTQGKEVKGTDIDDNLISQYFRKLANTNEQHSASR